MVVYRAVCMEEIANMMGISSDICGPRGINTFKYEKNVDYRHFFYFYDSAKSFMKNQNIDRYHNKYSLIIAYDIDDELLNEHFGLGTYNYNKSVPDNISLLKYFETIYYPEFAIPTSLINKNMIIAIGNDIMTPVGNTSYDTLYAAIRKSEAGFLKYETWLFEYGTNVKEKVVLEHASELFPIGIESKKKIIIKNQ